MSRPDAVDEETSVPDVSPGFAPGPSSEVSSAPETPSPSQPAAESAAPPMTVASLVAELDREGLLDAQSRQRLIDDLSQTPPQLWPQIVATFRATLSYRKQHAQRTHQRVEESFANLEQAGSHTIPTAVSGNISPGPYGTAVIPATAGIPSPPAAPETGRFPGDSESASSGPPSSTNVSLPISNGKQIPDERAENHKSAPAEADRDPLADNDTANEVADTCSLPKDWREAVEAAIKHLRMRIDDATDQEEAYRLQLKLRLLEAALGRRDESMDPIAGVDPALQDYWSTQFFVYSLLENLSVDEPSAAQLAEARDHLLHAASRLGERCDVMVKNVAFVTSVQSWGVYTPFDKYEFVPGQKVLLYAEVENLEAVASPKGYHTAWRCSYEIFDEQGHRIADYEYPSAEEFCRGRRRDFFISCQFALPESISSGKHTLRLTVVDVNSDRIGHASIDFRVKGTAAP
ncbi:hypothetical protein [Thermostilla marina]